MGLIQAAVGSIGGTLADQWKDFYTVPDGLPATAALFGAVPRIRERLGVELPVRTLFEAPTISELARVIDARAPSRERPEEPFHLVPQPTERFLPFPLTDIQAASRVLELELHGLRDLPQHGIHLQILDPQGGATEPRKAQESG